MEKPKMIGQGDCDTNLGMGGKVEKIIVAVGKIGDAVYIEDSGKPQVPLGIVREAS